MNVRADYPVSGIEIEIENNSTGQKFTTKTNKDGKFSFSKLPTGTYSFSLVVSTKSYSVTDKRSKELNVVSPKDAASGLPTGKRQHKPMTISKELDKSSPKLAQACRNWVKDTYEKQNTSTKDYNSSRSNKTSSSAGPGDGIEDSDRGPRSSSSSAKSVEKRGRSRSSATMNDMTFAKELDKSSPKLSITTNSDRVYGHITILK